MRNVRCNGMDASFRACSLCVKLIKRERKMQFFFFFYLFRRDAQALELKLLEIIYQDYSKFDQFGYVK